MKNIFYSLLLLLLFSCNNNSSKLDEITKRQDALEAKIVTLEDRIDSIETNIELMTTTDSIFLETLKPKPGSLLYEIEHP